jgi:ApaG protein
MSTKITKGIQIKVDTFYIEEQSSPLSNDYLFAYRITILNDSTHTVQLISRHWHIHDGTGRVREVIGEGVVGETPILEPKESFQYSSGANIKSDAGKMYGTYTFLDIDTKKEFQVDIPEFRLIAPFKSN